MSTGFNAIGLTITEMQAMIELHKLCSKLGMTSTNQGKELHVVTDVGHWKFKVWGKKYKTISHKNIPYLKNNPDANEYHDHFKKFETDQEAIKWIYKHDKKLMAKKA